jgi:hypothetical protein
VGRESFGRPRQKGEYVIEIGFRGIDYCYFTDPSKLALVSVVALAF